MNKKYAVLAIPPKGFYPNDKPRYQLLDSKPFLYQDSMLAEQQANICFDIARSDKTKWTYLVVADDFLLQLRYGCVCL